MSDNITAYDNTVLGEGGYSDAGEINLNELLTGEDTSSTLLDAILPGLGVAGLLAKSRKGLQLIPKAQWNKVFGSKAVDKMPEGVKQLALAIKGIIKGGKMITDKGLKPGMIGKPKPTSIGEINELTKGYSMKVTDNLFPVVSKYTKGVPAVIPKGSPKQPFSNFGETALGITALTALLAAITASEGNDAYGWSDKIASFLRPDPDMGTKEQHDEDMINLLYSLRDNPKPEAKGQRLLEDTLMKDEKSTNEILLQMLREQINKSDASDEEDEGFSYPSKGYGALY